MASRDAPVAPAAAAHPLIVAKTGAADFAQVLDDRQRLVHQQRGLVNDGDPPEVPGDIEAGRVASREDLVETGAHRRVVAGDDRAEL